MNGETRGFTCDLATSSYPTHLCTAFASTDLSPPLLPLPFPLNDSASISSSVGSAFKGLTLKGVFRQEIIELVDSHSRSLERLGILLTALLDRGRNVKPDANDRINVRITIEESIAVQAVRVGRRD